ncbi:MAG: hypothetical protein K6F09_06570 [Clostridiales bacterium]|nr:hypothetical protein [Clostridiales bacterium]
MKKRVLSVLSAAFAVIMLVACLMPSAFAEALPEGSSVAVGQNSVHLYAKNEMTTYYFTAPETAYYSFSTNEPLRIFMSVEQNGDGEIYKSYSYAALTYMVKGETVSLWFWTEKPSEEDFRLSVYNLGKIAEAEMRKLPDSAILLENYDIYGIDSPDGTAIDLNGSEVYIKFTEGSGITMKNELSDEQKLHTTYGPFDVIVENGEGHYEVGYNEVTLVFPDGYRLSFNVRVIENPIRDIEIVKMPDKSTYTFGLDGKFEFSFPLKLKNLGFVYDYNFNGLRVQINYKNGTSATAVYKDGKFYIDGKPASCTVEGYTSGTGENKKDRIVYMGSLEWDEDTKTVTAVFLEKRDSAQIQTVSPKGFDAVRVFFRGANAVIEGVIAYFNGLLK